MNQPTPARLLAALALLGGAALLVVTALALVLADDIIRRGTYVVTAADRRTLEALVAAVPLVVGVAVVQVVAALGLLLARRWGAPLAAIVAGGWAVAWTYSLAGTLAGWPPFDTSARPDPASAMTAGVSMSAIGLVASLVVAGMVLVGAARARARQDTRPAAG